MSDMPNVFGNDFLYRFRTGRLPTVGEQLEPTKHR